MFVNKDIFSSNKITWINLKTVYKWLGTFIGNISRRIYINEWDHTNRNPVKAVFGSNGKTE